MSRIGPRYADCSLNGFEIYPDAEVAAKQRAALNKLFAFRAQLGENVEAGRGLVLFGLPGTGKDHLMAAMMGAACIAGFSVEWINGMRLYSDLRDSFDTGKLERELLGQYTSPDILAISDPVPPWGQLTPFQSAFLFQLIDVRYRRMKPIWVTANFAGRQDASDRLGAQIVDRLRDGSLSISCDWPSYRRGQ